LQLLSSGRVALVSTTGAGVKCYNEPFAKACKALSDAEFDSTRRDWTVPAASVSDALARLRGHPRLACVVSPLPELVQRLLSLRIDDDSAAYQQIPPPLEAQMFQFQRDGVRFGLRKGG
jgi:hypothetical protein